jgi:hypothetical protein
LAALRQLKEQEQALQFELFKAKLTAEDLARLEQDARARVKPHIGLSPERQLAVHKDEILKQWFVQQNTLAPRDASDETAKLWGDSSVTWA